ncbi:MAG: hypothetical protein KBH85_03985 [Lachnospiraceae bacterium]|nr:hypothetical protein [Lachnospiraceae bacterium]
MYMIITGSGRLGTELAVRFSLSLTYRQDGEKEGYNDKRRAHQQVFSMILHFGIWLSV